MAPGAAGQAPPLPEAIRPLDRSEAADALVAQGYALHAAFDPEAALARFRSAANIDTTHYAAHWLTAAESVAVGILGGESAAARRLFAEAVEYARKARALRPDGVEAHEWLAVALGRHALSTGIRQRVRLAEEILAVAMRAVELSPESAVGHHVVGQWHAEVRRVSGIERFIARRFLGGKTFGSANLDDALLHLRRAVELEPEELVHRLELARVYLDLDRTGEAQAEFTVIVEQRLVAPTDPIYKARANEYLARLDSRQR